MKSYEQQFKVESKTNEKFIEVIDVYFTDSADLPLTKMLYKIEGPYGFETSGKTSDDHLYIEVPYQGKYNLTVVQENAFFLPL
jgi:hypothetical protein